MTDDDRLLRDKGGLPVVVEREEVIDLYLDIISYMSDKHTTEATELIQKTCKRLKEILIPSEEFK